MATQLTRAGGRRPRAVRPTARRAGAALAVALAALASLPTSPAAAPARAADPDFPAYDARYHTYGEMVAEIEAAQAAHPDLVRVFSIGKSYQGRDIWAAKVSDNVDVDEPEPEVLVDALHHARERMGLEQALYFLRLLTTDYATDATVRRLVDSREVWIVFSMNPDGEVYDLTGSPYRLWRKNRQPTPGSRYIGTDLNRNYGYRWGCCGGSSANPAAWNFRGRSAFSAPETRALRDFVSSRVVDGRQQIRLHITLHTNGEQVLWPYGYTTVDVPPDMTREDHAVFVSLGRGMAARNGYRAMQSSDLYVTDGDEIDWLYGRQRIFSFTWELYPVEQNTDTKDHYSPDEVIARETARNRGAFLYALNAAGCVYGVIGRAQADCGPFFDDFEISRGWQGNPDGTDTATSGRWARANPASVWWNGPKQLGTTTSGSYDLVTGASLGTGPNANDLDGITTIRSTAIQLPAVPGPLTFRYYFAHSSSSSSADWLQVWIEAADGTRTLVFREAGAANDDDAAWAAARVPMTRWAGQPVRIVIAAADAGRNSLVEAAIDDVRIERP